MFAQSSLSAMRATNLSAIRPRVNQAQKFNNKQISFRESSSQTLFAKQNASQWRNYTSQPSQSLEVKNIRNEYETSEFPSYLLGILLGIGAGLLLSDTQKDGEVKSKVNYAQIRKEIEDIIDDPNRLDGWGPAFVRLAWHASGTYSAFDYTGGSNGATMRFCPESRHGANNGLGAARDVLDKIKKKHPEISYGDLWVLASIVAIEYMGGPTIPFTPGRIDAPNGSTAPPDGRLPDATRNADHIRAIFYRMGFSDREIVALIGAHALGRCHEENSGFIGPWTNAPNTFSNDFYVQLLTQNWQKFTLPNGNYQYFTPDRSIMMLPTDMELIQDPDFKKWVVAYADDEDLFFKDFTFAYAKLVNFNLPVPLF